MPMTVGGSGVEASGRLEWAHVAGRLARERTLWVATVSAEGAPHVAPVWGAVWRGTFFMFTTRASAKAQNIAGNPQVAIHCESGEDVLIVRGLLVDVGAPAAVPDVVGAFADKYRMPGDADFLPGTDPTVDVVYALTPTSAMTWALSEFEDSQLRWYAKAQGAAIGPTR
jgi:hypothetical protein